MYQPVRLLGRGKGGYSYLAQDPQGRPVVLKKLHHEPCDYYEFGDKMQAELSAYETLRRVGIPMPALLAADEKAEVVVKEYIDGPTVFELVAADSLPPDCLAALQRMLDKLYPAGLNIDYFPTNFVWRTGELFYIDYECNPFAPEWSFEQWGRLYWSHTPQFEEQAHRLRAESAQLGEGILADLVPGNDGG